MSSSRRGSQTKRSAGARKPGSKGALRARNAPAAAAVLRALSVAESVATRRRPVGTRRLSEVQLEEDEVLVDVFDATLDGLKVRITAVLERTCVYVDPSGERRLASKKDILVEASELPIRRRGMS